MTTDREVLVKLLRDEVARVRCAAARGEIAIPGVSLAVCDAAIAALTAQSGEHSPEMVSVPREALDEVIEIIESDGEYTGGGKYRQNDEWVSGAVIHKDLLAVLAAAKEGKK